MYTATAELDLGIIATAGVEPNIDGRAAIGFGISCNAAILSDSPMGGVARNIQHTYTAGENLGGQRVVMIEGGMAYYFQPSDENNVGKQLGITKGAAASGQPVEVIHWGSLTDSGFAIITDEVYFAAPDGLYTTTPPTSGISQRIGVATASDTMLIQFSEPVVILADGSYFVAGYVEPGYIE